MVNSRTDWVQTRWLFVLLSAVVTVGCSSQPSTADDAASGGVSGIGGTGDSSSTGGSPGQGGSGSGGLPGIDAAGDSWSAGGATGRGGSRAGGASGIDAAGGSSSVGGNIGRGGSRAGGASGIDAAGGSSSAGGTTGRGGSGAGGASPLDGGTAGSSGSPTIAGCRIFPADNPWNLDISGYPPSDNSATYLANMSPSTGFHPDWGTVSDGYGIPFATGTGATPQPLTWSESWGASESDPLPCPSGTNQFCYPIPLTAPIEGGTSAPTDSDRHVLYIDTAGAPNDCTLYELYNAQNPTGSSGWTAANGAIFHLGSNALRPDGWTSADAAGLPILPGLVRLDEVKAGEIRHAIRFTVSRTYQGYIRPATHAAGNSNASLPPMGLRLRLQASFDTSTFSGPTLVILTAMKRYGIILADNGSNWYISGESNEGWAPYMDDLVSSLRKVHGSDFEVVDTGPVLTSGL
jgi:hypothetical protein